MKTWLSSSALVLLSAGAVALVTAAGCRDAATPPISDVIADVKTDATGPGDVVRVDSGLLNDLTDVSTDVPVSPADITDVPTDVVPELADITSELNDEYSDGDESGDLDSVEATDATGCHSEDLPWVRLTIDESGYGDYRHVWVLERGTRTLAEGAPDAMGPPLEVQDDIFHQLDCVISSAEFQQSMRVGFGCKGHVTDDMIVFTLELPDSEPIALDVTNCTFPPEQKNDAIFVSMKIQHGSIVVSE